MSANSVAAAMLSDDERAFLDVVRRFMAEQVVPLVPRMEKEGRPPPELLPAMGELGLLGTYLPEAYGGAGASLMTRALVAEETARVNAGLDASIFVNISLVARHLANHGSEEQKRKYLVPLIRGECSASICLSEPHGGSDALSPRTVGRRDGADWLVDGSKTFITNAPISAFFLVFARTSGEDRRADGGTCFIVDRDMEGLSVGEPFDKMSLKSSPTAEVFLSDVRVPAAQILGEVDRGFHYMLEGLDLERVFEGASTVGIAQACLDVAAPYALQREVFGRPIAQYQMIQDKIATMAMGIETARLMFYHLVRALERGETVTRDAAILKLYASQVAVEASREAVQILGGYGLMEEYQAARLYRDAKHHEIGAGTSEIQKIIIARETLKLYGG
ncbi:MAG: acyl-CoA dehydrogenase family protein [Alphaproteobacteria bacterium]|jgi:alkylation response protein AidB-like acyl-CoA dehydrogenase|nr:acyl-CoA dehydrogenase family protein [Alphaproteobacteria bacterium]MDP6566725.1 acyl-CoA dehydrogenase family protein [Alphaproteobacteria bacterium]MDP6814218.1 acyl-CoA dehydrogenase family protein [Alphaproteobacteria bacterium]